MKKITILSILSLLGLNLLFIPTITTSAQINRELNSWLSSIPDNTAYFYYEQQGDLYTNEFIQEQIEDLNFVKSTSYQQLYEPQFVFCYQSPCVEQSTTQPASSSLEIPIAILEESSDQTLPIVSGDNLSGDNQVVVSSSLVSNLGLNNEQVIGQPLAAYTIVGVYQDPYPYIEYNNDRYLPFARQEQNSRTETYNQAYTIDSHTKETNKLTYFVEYSKGVEAYTIDRQVLTITFTDDNLEQNLDSIREQFDSNNIILTSNLTPNSSENVYINFYAIIDITRNLVIVLIIVDLISICGLIALNRKKV